MNEIDKNTETIILDTAEEIFIEKGYAATKMTDIASRVGVNHAMLHYYFRTKENLFGIVFKKQVELLANSFLAILDKNGSFIELINEAIVRHFDFIKVNPKVVMFILSEINNSSAIGHKIWQERSTTIFSQVIFSLKEKMEIEIKAGHIYPVDPMTFLVTLLSLNIFIFIAMPLFESLRKFTPTELNEFIEQRKTENIRLVLLALKP